MVKITTAYEIKFSHYNYNSNTLQYVPPSRTGKGNALRTARFTDTAAAKPMRLPAPPFAPPFSAISEPDLISEIGPPTSLPLKIERQIWWFISI